MSRRFQACGGARLTSRIPVLHHGRALPFGPGTVYRCSSYGWIMVGAAVEAAAGRAVLHLRPAREASLRVDIVLAVFADLQAVAGPVDV